MRKKIVQRLMNFILILSMIAVPEVVFAGAASFIPDTRYYETSCTWETYNDNPDLFATIKDLPPNTPAMAHGRPFNYRIWFAKGKVSYGKPEDANPDNGVRVNYKEETRNSSGIGFFKKSGKARGEYRNIGYTVDGNLYTNLDFPPDVHDATALEDKAWVYQPWQSSYVKSYEASRGEPALNESDYNKIANNPNSTDRDATRNWINKGISAFKIKNGVTDTGMGNPAPGKKADGTWDAYNFINVLSAPTSRFTGEGRMFRLDSNRHVFYQTFSIQKYAKQHTSVEVTVKILNQSDLKFDDFCEDNPSDFATQTIIVKVEVDATLKDTEYAGDPIKEAIYYTRKDKDHWKISLDGQAAPKAQIQMPDNTAKTVFTIPMSKGQIKSLNGGSKTFSATARIVYADNQFDQGSNNKPATFQINPISPPAEEPTEDDMPPPMPVEPDCDIPTIGFDIVTFPAHDNTDMSGIATRKVYINGQQVDDNEFFSGSYVFGIGEDGLKKIDVYYETNEGESSFLTNWAYIYDTKPTAQFQMTGAMKQNRKITVIDTSTQGNVKIVTNVYPITGYDWSFRALSGDGTSMHMKDLSNVQKQLLYKKPGSYEITLTVTNTLGRVSDPYVFDFEVFPDYQPAVEIDLDNSVVTRGETVGAWNYSAVSTDGDQIASNTIQLWYDSNDDGTYDQILNTYDGRNGFPAFTPTKLGRYKFVDTVTESFGEDTIPEFITPNATVVKTVEREFLVDNLEPMTGLYVQIPIVRPKIDAYFMLDANLNSDKTNYVINNRINIDNALRSYNILPDIVTWDMKTYTYSQPASTSRHTGSSYPSSTVSYTSNGYSGTLSRTSVSNNSYQVDEGHYESRTESKTATGTRSGWSKGYYKYTHGSWVMTGSDGTDQPTMSYSDSQGFTGTLSKVSTTTDSDSGPPPSSASEGATYTRSKTYTGYYSGTVTRTVQVWVPNLVWHDDYTGYYSGTIYKNVRQPYVDPFRATSDKYVIYVSDGNISELNDLKSVVTGADAKLILIGQDSIKNQIAYDYYISSNVTIEQAINAAVEYISQASPDVEEYTVLAGTDTFTMSTADFDEERDPLTEQKLQYVQDQNYFDNPTGKESYAVTAYSDTTGWVENLASMFTEVGKYTIYRRIKDMPSADPNFADYAKYSGVPQLVIYAHRKPIARVTLDWDYDSTANAYNTTWADESYDLDHQYNRPDKGIVERKIMYRPVGGEWMYRIPDRLSPGSYELQYYVKDVEGAWSDPFAMSLTLSPAPPMQFDANLRTLGNKFTLSSIPASEYLEAYNVWTRYPYNVRLDMALYKGATRMSTVKTVNYSSATGVKDDNDIYWNNVPYQIPDTVPDGAYTFRITAVGDYGQSANKDFPVTVNTPINLSGMINGASSNAQVQADSYNSFTFSTSKYVTQVNLNFKGQIYSSDAGTVSLAGSDGATKTWEARIYVPATNIIDGETGYATFTATTPSGKSESANVNYVGVVIQAYDFTITSIQDINWRGFYFDLSRPINGDGEAYGYPKRANTEIKTLQMPINSLGLVPYSKDSVAAGCRVEGYIHVKGNPDSVGLKAKYTSNFVSKSVNISLSYAGSDKYEFSWIIPPDTDTGSFIGFDAVLRKGSTTYGNEKWADKWAQGNSSHWVFAVKSDVANDIIFNQSN